jgi:hypothetical protein
VITEATVIAVAAAIYLLDCVVLLERGQALCSGGSMSFGSQHYQMRGRVVALLNPFTPFISVFRTLPLFSASSALTIPAARQVVSPLAALSLLQLLLVFVALPYCLYRAPGGPLFLFLLLTYINTAVMLVLLWWRFRTSKLATRPLLGLGFACLVCLPLSVNAQRKAGLAFDVGVDAREAIRGLPEPVQERARAELAAQVAEALQELEESDERHRRLAELRRELAPEAGHGRL